MLGANFEPNSERYLDTKPVEWGIGQIGQTAADAAHEVVVVRLEPLELVSAITQESQYKTGMLSGNERPVNRGNVQRGCPCEIRASKQL